MRRILYLTSLAAVCLVKAATAAEPVFVVETILARDEKAVFATVESQTIVPARVRTGGTIVSLSVREGDLVRQGQVIAVLTDRKLAQQIAALDAGINGLKAQQAQAQAEVDRNVALFDNGVTSKTAMDQLRTALALASSGLKARQAERAALEEQITQGQVLAPATGRVLTVPVAVGAVMMGGEAVAMVATEQRVIRMQLPESNARSLVVGDMVRIEGDGLSSPTSITQTPITLIYPQITQGVVQADMKIPDAGGYFVGQRVRAWVPMEPRPALVVPAAYLVTRFGMDYARLRVKDGQEVDAPVVRGQTVRLQSGEEGAEVLAGLKPGDALVRP